MRIATYSQDGLGLGHMRRTHLIASQFLGLCPDASVLTLSDSPLGQFFTPAPNHDYLKLPSIVKDGPGQWRAANLTLPFSEVSALRRELIERTVLGFRPQILLVDHMPHGAMGELLPTLAALRASGAETKIVLGLRDILDAPEVVQSRWQIEGAYDAVEQYYDRVLVYGMRDVFDLAEQYRFSPSVADRLRYCGYVCESPKQRAPELSMGGPRSARQAKLNTGVALRRKLLTGAHACAKLVVAMAGGGADAYPMMRTLVDAMPVIQRRQHSLLVLITGPFMPFELRKDLKVRAQGLPVRIITSVDDTNSYLQAADLVVAMAGYNTSVEILQSGKRAIFVPRRGPSAEQRTRAQLFAARGWVDMLDPDELSVDTLVPLVVQNLSLGSTLSTPNKPDLQGMHVAAAQLVDLLPTPAFHFSLPSPMRNLAYELA
ncbi:MAG: glycosyltransferase [Chloroflexi bacterium]|nr:glycosyltransferase [Chloroflexota bacterium]